MSKVTVGKPVKVTKDNLADALASAIGVKKDKAVRGVNAVIDALVAGLKDGYTVELRGLGSFSVAHRKVRQGTTNLGLPFDPKGLGSSALKAVVRFKAGKGLRWFVNVGVAE